MLNLTVPGTIITEKNVSGFNCELSNSQSSQLFVNNSNLRILIVDDNACVRDRSVNTLKNIGCKDITIATGSMQALEKLQQMQTIFDVIIYDLNMSKIGGVEFMRRISNMNFTGGFILLGNQDTHLLGAVRDLARIHNFNVLDVISKPPKPEVIKSLLDNFKPEQKEKTSTPLQSITEEELRTGLHGDELQFFYQPKISMTDGTITGVESLARWNHPERGILGASAFIPLAESVGLIDELTYAAYRKIMNQAGEWQANDIDLKLSVNVSVNTLTREGFPDFLISTAERQNVDLSKVVLEITEHQVMTDAKKCFEILMKLRMKNIGLSIDDFGTGHSSMGQLKDLPFTELKIDRSFVDGAADNARTRAILETSLDLARKLKMETVAEGVETREDWDLIQALGCNYVQGFYCAKPMANDDFLKFYARWTSELKHKCIPVHRPAPQINKTFGKLRKLPLPEEPSRAILPFDYIETTDKFSNPLDETLKDKVEMDTAETSGSYNHNIIDKNDSICTDIRDIIFTLDKKFKELESSY